MTPVGMVQTEEVTLELVPTGGNVAVRLVSELEGSDPLPSEDDQREYRSRFLLQ